MTKTQVNETVGIPLGLSSSFKCTVQHLVVVECWAGLMKHSMALLSEKYSDFTKSPEL